MTEELFLVIAKRWEISSLGFNESENVRSGVIELAK